MLQHSVSIIALAAVTLVAASCASAREEESPVPPEYVIPAGARVEPAEYLDTLATGEGEEGELLIRGEPEFPSQVYGRRLLRAPVTGRDCLYYWLEIAYETPEADYHLLTDISDNALFVYVGDAYVAVDRPRRAEGRPPDYVMTFQAGEEPEGFPPPAHSYPEVTYRLWLLEPGREYAVRVYKYGSAYESAEDEGKVIYEVHYHFTFR
jgi:hypothetical protein